MDKSFLKEGKWRKKGKQDTKSIYYVRRDETTSVYLINRKPQKLEIFFLRSLRLTLSTHRVVFNNGSIIFTFASDTFNSSVYVRVTLFHRFIKSYSPANRDEFITRLGPTMIFKRGLASETDCNRQTDRQTDRQIGRYVERNTYRRRDEKEKSNHRYYHDYVVLCKKFRQPNWTCPFGRRAPRRKVKNVIFIYLIIVNMRALHRKQERK